jgi:hypothetical protein
MFHRATSSDIERIGAVSVQDTRRLLEAFRRHLPLVAHPRGRLRACLMRVARDRGSNSRCKVTNVFDAGETLGLMCRVEVGDGGDPLLPVAPITELSFDRTHPIARDVADYRPPRATRVGASQISGDIKPCPRSPRFWASIKHFDASHWPSSDSA